MCSDNVCTKQSDVCIGAYVKEINSVEKLPEAPKKEELSDYDRLRIARLCDTLYSMFTVSMFTAEHYYLADALFGVLPYYVVIRIAELRKL